MEEKYYPWGGEFTACQPTGCVGVVLLNIDYTPPQTVAIYGSLKTENIGIEKIVANVISNPYIRYLVVCGDDIRGHRSGASLIALHQHGVDYNHRVIDAPGAIPYIENIGKDAITRFQQQIEIINLLGVKEKEYIDRIIVDRLQKSPPSFGEPFIAIRMKPVTIVTLTDSRALHSKIVINYMGKIQKRGD